MAMTSEDLKRKVARVMALKLMAKSHPPRPEGRSDGDIVDMVVQKVEREVGGSNNPGLGTVSIGNKLALAARYLAQDHGIVIDPGSITIERTADQNDFQLLRVLLASAIKDAAHEEEVAEESSAGPDPDEVRALQQVTGDLEEEIENIIGSPSNTAGNMLKHNMSLDELCGEDDAAKVRNILVHAGKLKSKASATPQLPTPISPEEANLQYHLTASRRFGGEGHLDNKELYVKLAKCLVGYSYGPDQRTYPFSVEFDEKTLTVKVVEIKRSQLNRAHDIGLGADNKNTSLELQLGKSLFEMSSLIQDEFKGEGQHERYGPLLAVQRHPRPADGPM